MTKRLFGLAIFAGALMVTLSAAPAFASEAPTAPAVAAPVAEGFGQAIALPAVSGAICSASQPESVIPGVIAAPAARRGYCHCGCSSVRTCQTSADCGGASCDQTISCC